MKRAIVTGASGFIGSALTEKLSRDGIEVFAVIRRSGRGKEKLTGLKNVNIVCSDLNEIRGLPGLIARRGFDCFFHMAWQGVADEDAKNIGVQLANVQYSYDAVISAVELGCRRFVFPSSIMEYEAAKLMQTELDVQERNIYRTAKTAATYMSRIAANNSGIIYNAAIISNVYGPGEISQRFICTTLRKLLKREHVGFTEGKQWYDFIYIDDAVKMLCLIGESGAENRSYYVGHVKPRRLLEYIYEMRDCIDPQIELGIGESREFVGVSLEYTEFNTRACCDDFGFVPQYTFREGIEKTIQWLRGYE